MLQGTEGYKEPNETDMHCNQETLGETERRHIEGLCMEFRRHFSPEIAQTWDEVPSGEKLHQLLRGI